MNKKQNFHIEPVNGLINDPNGLVFYKGTYYIFFQWNRFRLDHSYKEWGMYCTKDWLTWKFHGSAIIPDQDYDLQGIYSGSGYEINNQLCLYYTGNSKIDGRRKSTQCFAVSDDGQTFFKKGVVLSTPPDYTEHFRDPKVFQGRDGNYYMVVGGQKTSGSGAIALCQSKDGQEWNYIKDLAVSSQYQMVECPDLVSFNEDNVLIYCLQKRDNERDENLHSFSVYQVGVYDESRKTFSKTDLDNGYKYLDFGFDFYAPQTFLDAQGRRILVAWMSNMDGEQEEQYSKGEPRLHCLTLPRELRLIERKLYQTPIGEMYGLLGELLPVEQEYLKLKACLQERSFYLKLTNLCGESVISIDVFDAEIIIMWDSESKKFSLLRYNWVSGTQESVNCLVEYLEQIEMWHDTSSIEIFINNGEYTMSSRVFPKVEKGEVVINGLRDMEQVQLYSLNSFGNDGGETDE